jgi:hypothetical protein
MFVQYRQRKLAEQGKPWPWQTKMGEMSRKKGRSTGTLNLPGRLRSSPWTLVIVTIGYCVDVMQATSTPWAGEKRPPGHVHQSFFGPLFFHDVPLW